VFGCTVKEYNLLRRYQQLFIFTLAMELILYHPEFITATIFNWMPLLQSDNNKKIIEGSLIYLVKDGRIILYSYCIMDNHIHLIWQVKGNLKSSDIRRDFFKYTAQQLKKSIKEDIVQLEKFKSTQVDRIYQIWERSTLSVEAFSPKFFNQKLDYIHYNPVKAGLCCYPEEYKYSSAMFYLTGEDKLGILSHSEG
jgi:REP element-mobilizing transposase RayT